MTRVQRQSIQPSRLPRPDLVAKIEAMAVVD